jgi:HSP20 family protein
LRKRGVTMSLLPKRKSEVSDRPGMLSLRDEVNRVFDEFFGHGWLAWPFEREWAPALDVCETDSSIQVKAEVPGIAPEDIEISLTGDTLTIKGQKREQEKKEGENYYRMERRYGSFHRAVRLPAPVDPAKVSATYKDGVLNVSLEKAEQSKAKSIKIEVEK